MKFFHILGNLLATSAAALAGIWLGGQLRTRVTGQPTATLYFEHTTPSGLHLKNSPVNTKFYPALLFSLLGQPRGLFAFLGGVLASLYIDDRYEAIVLEKVIAPLIENRFFEDRH